MSTFSGLSESATSTSSRLDSVVSQLSRPGDVNERDLNLEAQRLLRELDSTLKKMDLEVKAAPPSSPSARVTAAAASSVSTPACVTALQAPVLRQL